jgi:Flp pilus assembly protein TadG
MILARLNTVIARIRRERNGNAVVEYALVAPLLFGLMLVTFDGGMYMYSFICVQSAARSAALRNSGSVETATDQATACSIVTNQLQGLPSIGSAAGACGAAPLIVTSILCGASACGSFGYSADRAPASLVTVKYTLPFVFGIAMTGPPVIAATSQMKLRSLE